MSAAVKSAARAIEVLNYFASVREPQALKDICRSLEYPQSSMTVLLKTLMSLGYLNFDRTRRVYFPTIKVTSLGDWIPVALFGQGKILEIMRDVHYATKETIVLTIKNDIYIQYIAIIESSYALRFHVPEGSLRLMTSSAIGWLLMSQLKDREVESLIRRSNIVEGKPTNQNLNLTLDRVKMARKDGYAYAENVPFVGGATLCVPLQAAVQGQTVALGCGSVVERMRENRERYFAILQKCAALSIT